MMLELYLLALFSFICGLLVKVTDFFEDDLKSNKKYYLLADSLGLLYGLIIAGVLVFWPSLAPLVFGAILGEIVAKKIDAPAHILGVIAFLIIVGVLVLLGGVNISIDFFFLFLFCLFLVASIFDEKLDNYSESVKKNMLLKKALSLRPVLEIVSIGVFIFTLNPFYWISIFSFDLAYVIFSKNLPLIFNKKKIKIVKVK